MHRGDQVGVNAMRVYPIPNLWVRPQSVAYYFAGYVGGLPNAVCPGARAPAVRNESWIAAIKLEKAADLATGAFQAAELFVRLSTRRQPMTERT